MKAFQQPSVMASQQHFSSAPSADVPRSRFDRSHGHKTTMNAAKLVPIFVDEVLPGDTFTMKDTAFARLSTPLKPVMDNMYFETFFFFVPYRLVWENWERFMGERSNPTDDPSLLSIPQITVNMSTLNSNMLAAYLGVPRHGTGSVEVSALPFRAYWLIYNEWFRDQNLLSPALFSDGDTETGGTLVYQPLATRCKRHDYFTSCLPWPQKGDPVLIPVDDIPIGALSPNTAPMVYPAGYLANTNKLQITATGAVVKAGTAPPSTVDMLWSDPKLQTAMTETTGATINDLRTAFQIQKLLERDARGGTRYRELILSHFGVASDDARLQRPELLGSSSARINITPVPATFSSAESPQGELSGVGTVVARGGFNKSFTEHGIIIGLANVRADLTYQQGLERFWTRRTRYDFYWPALAHLGEQAVLKREIYCTGDAPDYEVFGYQERFAEYRYKPSRISGRFASVDAQSLDVWHLAQDFATVPALNGAFIEDNPPIDRIVAVVSEPHFLVDIWFELQCSRPMPVYSVPGMADHF